MSHLDDHNYALLPNGEKRTTTPTQDSVPFFDCGGEPPSPYKCNNCNFNSPLKVVAHKNQNASSGDPLSLHDPINSFTLSSFVKCYVCKICNFETYSLLVLTRHALRKCCAYNLLHKCPECPFFTRDDEAFKQHRRTHDVVLIQKLEHNYSVNVKEDAVRCEYCSFVCCGRYILRQHILSKHRYRCSECSFKTRREMVLSEHFSKKHIYRDGTHWFNQECVKQFECGQCFYKTSTELEVKVHMVRKHRKLIQCVKCDFTTNTQMQLAIHTSVKHPRNFTSNAKLNKSAQPKLKTVRSFKCEGCGFQSTSEENIKTHIYKMHTNAEVIQCLICSFKAPTMDLLVTHMWKQHPRSNRYQCDYCEADFATSLILKGHIISKHKVSKWIFCDQCSYKTKILAYLKDHILVKHSKRLKETKRMLWLQCDLCSYITKSPLNLKHHKVVKHTKGYSLGDKTKKDCWLKCEKCDYKTVQRVLLLRHKQQCGSEPKLYKCEACPYQHPCYDSVGKHVYEEHTNALEAVPAQ